MRHHRLRSLLPHGFDSGRGSRASASATVVVGAERNSLTGSDRHWTISSQKSEKGAYSKLNSIINIVMINPPSPLATLFTCTLLFTSTFGNEDTHSFLAPHGHSLCHALPFTEDARTRWPERNQEVMRIVPSFREAEPQEVMRLVPSFREAREDRRCKSTCRYRTYHMISGVCPGASPDQIQPLSS